MKNSNTSNLSYLQTFLLTFSLLFSVYGLAESSERVSTLLENEQRLALVIGNADYKDSPLSNPINDAQDMAETLQGLNFEVILLKNASQKSIERSIRQFGKKLHKGGVGLFYYAGHGLQANGHNFLLPIDAEIHEESDIKYEAVHAGRVIDIMHSAGNRLNIVILDACRNNPFARSFRSLDRGLARMDAPKGTMIAYATAPGRVAADGAGRNGVYTKYLLRYLPIEGMPIEKVFKSVRVDVLAETNNLQIPWESSSLTGDFYFSKTKISSSSEELPSKNPTPKLERYESITKQRELEKKWQNWQAQMVNSWEEVETLDKNSYLTSLDKLKIWKEFTAQFGTNNPFSSEDDQIRKIANQKIAIYEANLTPSSVTKHPMMMAPGTPTKLSSLKNYESIIKQRELEKKWQDWQLGMAETLENIKKYDQSDLLTQAEKANLWQDFLSQYNVNNPYSTQDDELIEFAKQKEQLRKQHTNRESLPVDQEETLNNNIATDADDVEFTKQKEQLPKQHNNRKSSPVDDKETTNKNYATDTDEIPLKVAMLPWKPNSSDYFEVVFNIILKEVEKKKNLNISHSSYKIYKKANVNFIDKNITKRIWQKQGLFSSSKLNLENVAKIGHELGVNIIILGEYNTREKGVHTILDSIKIYIFNVQEKSLQSFKNTSSANLYMGNYDPIYQVISDALKHYDNNS